MRGAATAALAAALLGGLAAGAAAAPAAPVSVTIDARAGKVGEVVAGLGRGALRVQRRDGRRLQVVAERARVPGLRRLPGVAGARVASSGFEDAVTGQGPERTGADVLGRVANGGSGLVIAVLDLGFGQGIARLQALGELPPPDRLETLSFDPAAGLAGTNAYGNRTNHGELVAQTVFDYAPAARYIFANYHTEADFLAATDALIARRPDIVVHSNSFIEGPFDGTGVTARAVDRAAAAGILWFNSAGNYAQLHWEGPWSDATADGVLDWPNGDAWTFPRGANQPITFALSWPAAPGTPTDIDLTLERLEADGSWTPVAASADRQSAGAPPAERITGYLSPVEGTFRLRARRVSGPAPTGDLTLFSREIGLSAIAGGATGSLPTPGDAAGAIAVGAVDWRGNRPKAYSSQGPTDDGRLKPDLVAPTDTRLLGPGGARSVGGTSNAAPNAAGAAAVLLAAERRAGRTPAPAQIRDALVAGALDLGAPGPDPQFGAGRVRVSLVAPRVGRTQPAPLASVRGRVNVRFTGIAPSRLTSWTLAVDGVPALARAQAYPRGITIDTRRLADGFHALRAEVRDWPGNAGAREWAIRVDNTRPTLIVRRVVVGPPRPVRGPQRRRVVRLVVAVADPGTTGSLRAALTVTDRRGARVQSRTRLLRAGARRAVALAPLRRGRYLVRLAVTDRAGNAVTVHRRVLVR